MCVDLPVWVNGGQLNIQLSNSMISAFALLNKDFKDKTKSQEELQEEAELKHLVREEQRDVRGKQDCMWGSRCLPFFFYFES